MGGRPRAAGGGGGDGGGDGGFGGGGLVFVFCLKWVGVEF